jgi:hypothetical protein
LSGQRQGYFFVGQHGAGKKETAMAATAKITSIDFIELEFLIGRSPRLKVYRSGAPKGARLAKVFCSLVELVQNRRQSNSAAQI